MKEFKMSDMKKIGSFYYIMVNGRLDETVIAYKRCDKCNSNITVDTMELSDILMNGTEKQCMCPKCGSNMKLTVFDNYITEGVKYNVDSYNESKRIFEEAINKSKQRKIG